MSAAEHINQASPRYCLQFLEVCIKKQSDMCERMADEE